MEVKVLFFAQLEELFGISEMKIQGVKNTSELIIHLTRIEPRLKNYTYSIAVNEELIKTNKLLKLDDVIALLPPFAGG